MNKDTDVVKPKPIIETVVTGETKMEIEIIRPHADHDDPTSLPSKEVVKKTTNIRNEH